MEQLSINEEGTNCCQSIVSNLIIFFKNLVKFLLALWTIADMALDVTTTHFYYQRSFAYNDTITNINDTMTFNDTITANDTSQVSIIFERSELRLL